MFRNFLSILSITSADFAPAAPLNLVRKCKVHRYSGLNFSNFRFYSNPCTGDWYEPLHQQLKGYSLPGSSSHKPTPLNTSKTAIDYNQGEPAQQPGVDSRAGFGASCGTVIVSVCSKQAQHSFSSAR